MSLRHAEIAFGLSMITVIGAAVLVVVPSAFLFYLAGVCVGWGFHAGVAKYRNSSASTTKAEDQGEQI